MARRCVFSRFSGWAELLSRPYRTQEPVPMRLDHAFRLALAATMALVVACHDSTSPTPRLVSFDPAKARARVEPLAKIFDQPIFTSFQGAMSAFESYFRSGGSIPDNVKGKTF